MKSTGLGFLLLFSGVSGAADAQPRRHFEIPASVRHEHQAVHARLEEAIRAGGTVGRAASDLAQVLGPHFQREEEIALPPLALLADLAGDRMPAGAEAVLPMTDALKSELPAMLQEHQRIRAAVDRLRQAAIAEKKTKVVSFADQLAQHAQAEEEVYYPAAVLVGEVLRARLQR